MNVLDETAEERLTCFLYLLTRDSLAWGEMSRVLRESSAGPNTYTSSGAEAMARSFARELLGLPLADAAVRAIGADVNRFNAARGDSATFTIPRCLQGLSEQELSQAPKLTAEAVEAAIRTGQDERRREENALRGGVADATALEGNEQVRLRNTTNQGGPRHALTHAAAVEYLRENVETALANVPHTDECYSGDIDECDCWQSKVRGLFGQVEGPSDTNLFDCGRADQALAGLADELESRRQAAVGCKNDADSEAVHEQWDGRAKAYAIALNLVRARLLLRGGGDERAEQLARFTVVDSETLEGWTEGDKQTSRHEELTFRPGAWEPGTTMVIYGPEPAPSCPGSVRGDSGDAGKLQTEVERLRAERDTAEHEMTVALTKRDRAEAELTALRGRLGDVAEELCDRQRQSKVLADRYMRNPSAAEDVERCSGAASAYGYAAELLRKVLRKGDQ